MSELEQARAKLAAAQARVYLFRAKLSAANAAVKAAKKTLTRRKP
jgi:multidrug resistance efflux pump